MVITLSDTRERIRVARFPIDSKLAASVPPTGGPVGVGTSLEFDGTTSMKLANSTIQDWGYGNAWTWVIWWKRISDPPANVEAFLVAEAAGNENRTRVTVHPDFDDRQNWLNYMSDGSNYKRLSDTDYFTGFVGSWVMFGLRWGGGTDLQMVRNTTIISSSDTDPGSGGTMTNTDRKAANWFNGDNSRIHSIALWNVKLNDSNITAVYNGGDGTNFDLRMDSGNYNQSANLLHWWVFGADDSTDNAMGTDWGSASNLINIMDNSSGVTTADLVVDSPT